MQQDRQAHWERVYSTLPDTQVSWFQDEPAPSLAMIADAGVGRHASIIDVGGGASRLVDRLLEDGFGRISVLDISSQGLAVARARLGDRASALAWLVEDVTQWSPAANAYDLWHDRAVFHFLVEKIDRAGYRRALLRGLRKGGHAILAPFALSGPARCSGLPVRRYSAEALAAELGPTFELVKAHPESHLTPGRAAQDFIWCLFRKVGD